jgi:Helix-turn-helix domain
MIRRRVLARQLRLLREAAGLTLEEAAPKLDFSVSKLCRIENAQILMTAAYLRPLYQSWRSWDSASLAQVDLEVTTRCHLPTQNGTTGSRVGTRQQRSRPAQACLTVGDGCQSNPMIRLYCQPGHLPPGAVEASAWNARRPG